MGNQSGYIVGFILVAFVVYITLKGELPIYAGLLLLSPSTGSVQSAAAPAASPQQSSAVQSNSQIAAAVQTVAPFLLG